MTEERAPFAYYDNAKKHPELELLRVFDSRNIK
jgi:hypothetical protein